jgi:DNA-binding beta-propeller fold protein YncE
MQKLLLSFALLFFIYSCSDHRLDPSINENPANFTEIGSIDIGDIGAAEISAYDPVTGRLFVVNNFVSNTNPVNKIDVIDMSNPSAMKVIASISMAPYGGAVNSLSVYNGKLAAAIESLNKQENGKVAVFNTIDYKELKVITVGALPDMITFSPDGRFIITANEGEPNDAYTIDPVGSVSIISVEDNYSVVTLDFASFAPQQAALIAKGLRIFGPTSNPDFARNIEPEYVTVSDDSKTAWVTLQENNAIATINLTSKSVTAIFPLGFKDYNLDINAIDISDQDNAIALKKWPAFGMYQPDGISVFEAGGVPYLFTANEGDAREYTGFTEMRRVSSNATVLDPVIFPNAATLKLPAQMGRLNHTITLGNTDADPDFEAIYSLGARSFSVWNGNDGSLVFDSKNDLEQRCISAGVYDDGRSDDKGVEPEGIALGQVGGRKIAFVGMERSDAVGIYDVSNPTAPVFLQLVKCGDAPEGVLFIPANNSPIQKSLLIVSSENDGVVKVYRPQ